MDKICSRLFQTVILLDRQYLITEHLIESTRGVLPAFEQAMEEQQQGLPHVLAVYNYVFGLVDHLVRYEKIAFSLPMLNQKSAEFRTFAVAMGNLKDIRNQLQHINNEIENDNSGPLLGTVCWISNGDQFLVSFNDVGRDRSWQGIVLNTHTGQYLHEFCYVYNDAYHDLGGAISGMRTFNEFVNSKFKVEIDGKSYDSKDHFSAYKIEFQLSPEN